MSSSALSVAISIALALCPKSPSAGGATAQAPAADQGTFLTQEEALRLAFPECEIERRRVFLSAGQKARVRDLAGTKHESSLAFPYVAKRDGVLVGTAYFDAHRVRTLRETLMVVVDAEGKICRIEMLAFAEPREYIPRGNWYGQFIGRGLDEDLSLKRKIRGVSGASMTARASVDCARRVLALHQVLAEPAEPTPGNRP